MPVAREFRSLPCKRSLTTGGETKQMQTGTSTNKGHVTCPGRAPVNHQESLITTTRNIDMTSQVNRVTGQPIGTMTNLQSGMASIESTPCLKIRVNMVHTSAAVLMVADQAVAACLQADMQARMTRGISTRQSWAGPAQAHTIAKDLDLRTNATIIGRCIKDNRPKK